MTFSPFLGAATLSLTGARTSAFKSLDSHADDPPPHSPAFEPVPRALLEKLKARLRN